MPGRDPFAAAQQQQRQRQQGAAWQAEQERKRKQQRQREAQLQSGGISIHDSDLDVRGDIVGRDKVHHVSASYPRDEKSGFVLFFQRGFALIWGFGVSLLVFGGMAALASSAMEDLGPLLLIGAVGLSLVIGFVSAMSVGRYRD